MRGALMDIHKAFLNTRKKYSEHNEYPKKPGLYSVFLSDGSELGLFGQPGRLLYIGIAKNSLYDRDFVQHFSDGQTRRSTLRRSLGAILKQDLRLVAIPRGGKNDSKNCENYKFTLSGETDLTNWMRANLEIGYWVPESYINYKQLRETEKVITIKLKPTLDLDNRTRRYNPLSDKLSELRKICKIEAQKY